MQALILLGWLSRDAAVTVLRNECIFDPPLTEAGAATLWAQYRDRVAALPQRDLAAPAQLAMNARERKIADKFLNFHRKAGPGGSVTDVIKIDPANLVTYQPFVTIEQTQKYAGDAVSAARFAKHSLATARGVHNIAVLGHGLNAIDFGIPHGEFAFIYDPKNHVGKVKETARHVSVTAFNDRLLLFAGYHRSYAFTANINPEGIDRSMLVALTTDGNVFFSPTSPYQGVREMVTGLRPPLLRDFLDDTLFIQATLRRKRYVLQVRAQCVPVNDI